MNQNLENFVGAWTLEIWPLLPLSFYLTLMGRKIQIPEVLFFARFMEENLKLSKLLRELQTLPSYQIW